MEIFKPVKGYEGIYEISNCGHLKSVRSKKILKTRTDKYGYLYTVISVGGKRKTVKIHRLVAEAFIPNPKNKPTVDHKNTITTDNRVENLRWATNWEQTNNPNTLPKVVASARERLPKMYEYAVKLNFNRKRVAITTVNGERMVFDSVKKAAEAMGVAYTHLSSVLNGNREQYKAFKAEKLSKIDSLSLQ